MHRSLLRSSPFGVAFHPRLRLLRELATRALGCLGQFLLLGASVSLARAQTTLHVFDDDGLGPGYAASVDGAGDVDGDGFDDLVVGGYSSVRVLSGASGHVLHVWLGTQSDLFGLSAAGAGDVNRDGFDDVIVGARSADVPQPGSGQATVFSGADGSVLHVFYGSGGEALGGDVRPAGDVDGDGFGDVIVGAQVSGITAAVAGSAYVFSGSDGSLLHSVHGDSQGDFLGTSVDGVGDMNGDGHADFVVGIPGDDHGGFFNAGTARVYSGADGSVLHTFLGAYHGLYLGQSVRGAGDVNADGVPDVIIGAPRDFENGYESGSAHVFSGADGSELYRWHGDSRPDRFGWRVDGAGDVNGDGHADLLVGAPQEWNPGKTWGSVRVFSGADGGLLHVFDGKSFPQHAVLGFSLGGAGDVNGDGLADVILSRAESQVIVATLTPYPPPGRFPVLEILDGNGDGAGQAVDTPVAVAVDRSGNVWVAAYESDNVFHIAPSGQRKVVLDQTGDGAGHPLVGPCALAVGPLGEVLVCGALSDNVFRIAPDGSIAQIADEMGDGQGHRLVHPGGIAVDLEGNAYVTGSVSDNVFRITPDGTVTQIADASGDGAAGLLELPMGIAVALDGRVYVAGAVSDNVLAISPGGEIRQVLDASGDGLGHEVNFPTAVAAGPLGGVYVACWLSRNAFHVDGDGVEQVIGVRGDGKGRVLQRCEGVAADTSGNVYVTGYGSGNVFRIAADGTIAEILDALGDRRWNALAGSAGIAVGAAGEVYVVGAQSHNAYRLELSGASLR